MSTAKKNWTYDEVQVLIQAVRKNPSLYDRRDPDYNQTRTKEVSCLMEINSFSENLVNNLTNFAGYLENNLGNSGDYRKKW